MIQFKFFSTTFIVEKYVKEFVTSTQGRPHQVRDPMQNLGGAPLNSGVMMSLCS